MFCLYEIKSLFSRTETMKTTFVFVHLQQSAVQVLIRGQSGDNANLQNTQVKTKIQKNQQRLKSWNVVNKVWNVPPETEQMVGNVNKHHFTNKCRCCVWDSHWLSSQMQFNGFRMWSVTQNAKSADLQSAKKIIIRGRARLVCTSFPCSKHVK